MQKIKLIHPSILAIYPNKVPQNPLVKSIIDQTRIQKELVNSVTKLTILQYEWSCPFLNHIHQKIIKFKYQINY